MTRHDSDHPLTETRPLTIRERLAVDAGTYQTLITRPAEAYGFASDLLRNGPRLGITQAATIGSTRDGWTIDGTAEPLDGGDPQAFRIGVYPDGTIAGMTIGDRDPKPQPDDPFTGLD